MTAAIPKIIMMIMSLVFIQKKLCPIPIKTNYE